MTRPACLPSSAVSVNLHVYETTAFRTRVYAGEDRVTVEASGSGGDVTLFLDRPDIARLRGVLDRAEQDLTDTQNDSGARAISGPAA